MSVQKEYWDKVYEANSIKTKYDLWLDKYECILNKTLDTPIIDLGCGLGNNTLYLLERNYKVISCDISEKALNQLKNSVGGTNTCCFDLKDGLPFGDSTAKIIISDLSLHYFTWKETQEILKDISRVLIEDGLFLCRVNSTNDLNYGAGQGTVIEENFYSIGEHLKRFFCETNLRELFTDWNVQYIKETDINRYSMKKVVWEIAVKKS